MEAELEDFFRDENSQILHRLQSSLMNTSLSDHIEATSYRPTPSAYFLPRKLRGKPTNENPYQVGGIRLQLLELQAEEQEVMELRAGLRSPYQVGGMRLQLHRADGRPVG